MKFLKKNKTFIVAEIKVFFLKISFNLNDNDIDLLDDNLRPIFRCGIIIVL